MNVNRLFARRWLDYWRGQLRLLRFTFDGIVMLYIGIPALLLLGRMYYGLWKEALPTWLQHLPFGAVATLILFFIIACSRLILYIEAADVLFLKQRRRWLHGIMLRGTAVSIVENLLALGVCFVLISPILVRVYGWSIPYLWSVLAVTFGVNTVYVMMVHVIKMIWSGWKQAIIHFAGCSLLGGGYVVWMITEVGRMPEVTVVVLVVCIALSFVLGWHRFHLKGRFDAEVREDERQKTFLTGLLLSSTTDLPRKAKPRPWLFRSSNRLLRSNLSEDRLAELLFKSFLRGRTIAMYGQFALLSCTAVYLAPFPMNLIVYAALLLLLIYWLNGHRLAFLTGDLMSILPLGEGLEYRSAEPAMRLLLYPAIIPMTCGLGAGVFHTWWGVLAAVPAGILITRPVSSLWRIFPSYGRRGGDKYKRS